MLGPCLRVNVASIKPPSGAVVVVEPEPGCARPLLALLAAAAAAVLVCVALGSASTVVRASRFGSAPTTGSASVAARPAATEPWAGTGHQAGVSALPAAVQGPVSAALGAGETGYRVSRLRAVNPAQQLRLSFSPTGVAVTSGAGSVGLSLIALGGLGALRATGPAAPRTRANRVTYRRAGLTEWYANGPAGLEQGFTVARRPANGAETLVMVLNVSGDLRPRLDGSGVLLSGAGTHLRYGGLSAVDARGRTLRAWLDVRGRRLLIEVADRDAAFPVRIDPFIQQASKLVGSGATGEAEQGHSVAISGDGTTALVGAPAAVAFGADGPGAVYVFIHSGQTWTEQARLTPADPAFGAQAFGWSVALSTDGSTALIGGPGPAIHAGDPQGPGGAWVFTRSDQSWSQQGPRLNGSDEVEDPDPTDHGTAFGDSVALSGDGNTALIGGFEDDAFHGAAWVFTRSGQTWTQQGPKLDPSDLPVSDPTASDPAFGAGVALSRGGDTALIGGIVDRNDLGSAWVFARSGQTWSQQGPKLAPSDDTLTTGGFFGASDALSADGNTALIGGTGGTPGTSNADGGAWVFTRSGQMWSQQGSRLHPADEPSGGVFGAAVALSADGNTALIGGRDDPFDATAGAGDAWEYTRAGANWSQRTPTLTASGESGAGAFGTAVALSDDAETALVGAPNDSGSLGAAWVFSRAAPQFTSASRATFVTGRPASLAISTSATPTASVSESGALPPGLTFTADGRGAASLAGTPAAGSGGDYQITLTAANGNAPDASQSLAVTVEAPPAVSIATPMHGARYTRGQRVKAAYSCSDGPGGPGLAACAAAVAAGGGLNTRTTGSHELTVTATSKDGLTTSQTSTYRVVLPNNHFTVSRIRPMADGQLGFSVKLPDAGRIDVLETAWNDNLTRAAIALQPAKRRFVYARAHRTAGHAGTVKMNLGLNLRGRRLVLHPRYRVTLRLWVSYTPSHGVPRSVGVYGLHLRRG